MTTIWPVFDGLNSLANRFFARDSFLKILNPTTALILITFTDNKCTALIVLFYLALVMIFFKIATANGGIEK